MSPARTLRQRIDRIVYFFPLRLLLLHIKNNHFLLLFWIVLIGLVSGSIGIKYGVHYLFFEPEYLGKVGFWSYFIVGISCGGFIMTYNIASYSGNGSKFRFIATLNRPFLKYSLNNMIIPLLFTIVYIWSIVNFKKSELQDMNKILADIGALCLGIALFLMFTYIYFFSTNKNIFQLFGITRVPEMKKSKAKPLKGNDLKKHTKNPRQWRVETYMSSPFHIRLTRGAMHYDNSMIMSVFNQNHRNSTILQVLVFATILLLGTLSDIALFEIPAGASLLLMFTMFLIITSVFNTIFRGWASAIMIFLVVVLNYCSQFELFNSKNKAYGLDYLGQKAIYHNDSLRLLATNSDHYRNDANHTLEILKKWRRKNSPNALNVNQKPKLVVVNTSGGGLKSSLWTMYVLQQTDSILNKQLLKHTLLMTGSSGGSIGASYARELYLQYLNGNIPEYNDKKYLDNISKDILNKTSFSLVVNDMFFPYSYFNDGSFSYVKDRAYAFELQLNQNTNFLLDKRLGDYYEPEKEALVPMIILSPTVVVDGRRLLISSQPVSYLANLPVTSNVNNKALVEEIEFSRLFKNQNAANLKFTSALRMNSTFPYIMPMVSLPSEPTIEVMDAGVRDNYGIMTTMKFIYTFRNWISTNTSGIIIIQIREKFKETEVKRDTRKTIMKTILTPIESFYDNIFTIQDYNNDQLLEFANLWFNGQIDIIDFQMSDDKQEHISLSWHLTKREKNQIFDAFKKPENKEAVDRLKELFKQN